MEIEELFSPLSKHLNALRINCDFFSAECVDAKTISDAETTIDFKLPEQLKELYLKFGNGLVFAWEDKRSESKHEAYGQLIIPALAELVQMHDEWKKLVVWMDDYEFPNCQDSVLAKKTYRRMKLWLPFWDEGNGDQFCFDCGDAAGAIVFHQHDWNDGGVGNNGHRLANNLFDFIAQWSKVSFTCPTSLWWPSTFTNTGVDWSERHFHSKFVVK